MADPADTNDRFAVGLERCAANHVPLTPLSFLNRAAHLYGDRAAVIDGDRTYNWSETAERCRRLASALRRHGLARNDVVALLAPNTAAAYEAHFGVPMSGAVLAALNVRLDADAIAMLLRHSQARILLVDAEFAAVAKEAIAKLDAGPLAILIEDVAFAGDHLPGAPRYEDFLSAGDPLESCLTPNDEWDAIALNYTSGTTGEPKGVVYHHRGAYLNAVNNALGWAMERHPVYLWTLPMFHCNGWCFPWTVAMLGGTNVCLRHVRPDAILAALAAKGVTHMCGAPIIFAMLVDEAGRRNAVLPRRVAGQIAGAPPPAALIESATRLGIELTHVYGLTEVYGPAAICEPQEKWASFDRATVAELTSRQGVPSLMQEDMRVLDPATMTPVPPDGETIGEIMFRGNIVMKGYLSRPDATREAFAGGWFHTGDLGVVHPDGYIKIVDRSKDLIISGGENISSVEIEDVLHRHEAVFGAAVVAKPDTKWGETPCAFVEPRPGMTLTAEILDHFCRSHLAGFKRPRHFVVGPLPRTSTGKIQKFELRKRAGKL